jgi:hypothetical protein
MKNKKKMIFLEFIHSTDKLSTWLITKFGVALGICNQLSLGWGTRELKKRNEKERGISCKPLKKSINDDEIKKKSE